MFLENISELSRGSNKKVMVVCDFQESEACLVKVMRRYSNVQNTMDKNNGKYICCSCYMMRGGRNHPSCKYKNLDDHLMDLIDTEAKAYLLGWIASDGSLNENGRVFIAINTCDVGVLEILRDFICTDLPIADHRKGAMKMLRICSTQWCKSIQKHLNLSFEKGKSHKKSHLVQMPVDISDSLKWCFLRGYFKGDGCVSITKNIKFQVDGLRVDIGSSSLAMRMMITTFCRSTYINICMYPEKVTLKGQYAARFLEKIYAGCDERFVLKRKYCIYKRLKTEMSRFWDQAAAFAPSPAEGVAEEAYLTSRMKNLTITLPEAQMALNSG